MENKATQFTPGPWELREKWIFPQGRDDDVAYVSQSYMRRGEERLANASLIATAPELLEALIHAITTPDLMEQAGPGLKMHLEAVNRQAMAIIAKARGNA